MYASILRSVITA
ncbi:Protein of unknown function [Propionibacterium freudenreichii]|nr:Protein of unknown function [Propionibacterium freudenreichii]CEI25511.1 Protein of unknown function [Propionibacterium freudenreichii]